MNLEDVILINKETCRLNNVHAKREDKTAVTFPAYIAIFSNNTMFKIA